MKLSEHAELYYLQKNKPKQIKVTGICELCQSCRGKCKTSVNLINCPGKEKWNENN